MARLRTCTLTLALCKYFGSACPAVSWRRRVPTPSTPCAHRDRGFPENRAMSPDCSSITVQVAHEHVFQRCMSLACFIPEAGHLPSWKKRWQRRLSSTQNSALQPSEEIATHPVAGSSRCTWKSPPVFFSVLGLLSGREP